MSETKNSRTSRIATCALFTALIAVLAQVAVPLPFSPVPFTGQVVGVLLTGALLGPKAALLTIVAYLLLGAAGAPVFSLARGGLYMLTGPTGGYLWGFIPAVFITAKLTQNRNKPGLLYPSAAMIPAIASIYILGSLQLALLMQYSIKQAVVTGVLPFLPFDLGKVVLAAFLAAKIKTSLHRSGLAHLLED